jgi:ribosomal protein S18 acetylase RimI-like enzyme
VSELKLRRYRESDQATVLELHVVGLKQVGSYGGDGPWDDDVRNIIEHYHQNEGEFLVGEYEGRVVAMGAFRKTGPREAEIKRMRTHPNLQGRGFGQQIYDALEVKAREMGYRRLHLETGVSHYPAQKLYTRNGFVETHRGTVHLSLNSIFYEKILDCTPEEEN